LQHEEIEFSVFARVLGCLETLNLKEDYGTVIHDASLILK